MTIEKISGLVDEYGNAEHHQNDGLALYTKKLIIDAISELKAAEIEALKLRVAELQEYKSSEDLEVRAGWLNTIDFRDAELTLCRTQLNDLRADVIRLQSECDKATDLITAVYRHGVHPSINDGSDVRLTEQLGIFLGCDKVEQAK